jgi:hypothetical protein
VIKAGNAPVDRLKGAVLGGRPIPFDLFAASADRWEIARKVLWLTT